MALIMCRCYRVPPVDSNLYPVEIKGGQNFGERREFEPGGDSRRK